MYSNSCTEGLQSSNTAIGCYGILRYVRFGIRYILYVEF